VRPPETLDSVLRQLMLTERLTRLEHHLAWEALYVLGVPDFYPNNWWLQNGRLSMEDTLMLIMRGEAAGKNLKLVRLSWHVIYFGFLRKISTNLPRQQWKVRSKYWPNNSYKRFTMQ